MREAAQLAQHSLRGAGFGADAARILADHMVDAALCGYEYSGLPKILNVIEYSRRRRPDGPMQIRHETPTSAQFDGGGNNGMLTIYEATRVAIAKAAAQGFAVVGVNNTWMSGRGAYYAEMLAHAGLIGIHTVSSRPQVAPLGGAAAALGTNPISFGFPTMHEPFLVDIGTSALMFTDLALRARRGDTLPEGVALDANGAPTRDPTLASLGAVLPFGGYKGFALGMAMQALGVLAGSGAGGDDNGVGYLIIAIKPDLMMPLDEYRHNLTQSIERVKATQRQPGVEEIRLPSERALRERARGQRDGIVIDAEVYDALKKWSGA